MIISVEMVDAVQFWSRKLRCIDTWEQNQFLSICLTHVKFGRVSRNIAILEKIPIFIDMVDAYQIWSRKEKRNRYLGTKSIFVEMFEAYQIWFRKHRITGSLKHNLFC